VALRRWMVGVTSRSGEASTLGWGGVYFQRTGSRWSTSDAVPSVQFVWLIAPHCVRMSRRCQQLYDWPTTLQMAPGGSGVGVPTVLTSPGPDAGGAPT